MRKRQLLGAAAIAAVSALLWGCGGGGDDAGKADAAKDAAAIKAVETQWNADIKARTLEPIIQHYTSDGTLMLPGAPAVHGMAGIRANWKASMADPAFTLAFEADRVEIAAAGDLAYTQGHFTETATDPATHNTVTVKGGYVTVFRKAANGTWRALEDIATPSLPAAGAAPAAQAASPTHTADTADVLKTRDLALAAAYAARDPAKIGSFIAPDGTYMGPGEALTYGPDTAGLTALFKADPAWAVTFAPDGAAISKSGDLGYTRGTFTLVSTDPATKKVMKQDGSYLTVWRRQADGSWLAAQDIDTPGFPATAAAAAPAPVK